MKAKSTNNSLPNIAPRNLHKCVPEHHFNISSFATLSPFVFYLVAGGRTVHLLDLVTFVISVYSIKRSYWSRYVCLITSSLSGAYYI